MSKLQRHPFIVKSSKVVPGERSQDNGCSNSNMKDEYVGKYENTSKEMSIVKVLFVLHLLMIFLLVFFTTLAIVGYISLLQNWFVKSDVNTNCEPCQETVVEALSQLNNSHDNAIQLESLLQEVISDLDKATSNINKVATSTEEIVTSHNRSNAVQLVIHQLLSNLSATSFDIINSLDEVIKNTNDTLLTLHGNSATLRQISNTTLPSTAQAVDDISDSVSTIENTTLEIEKTINIAKCMVEKLLVINNITTSHKSSCYKSCQDLPLNSSSGYYLVNLNLVYCEMGELCDSEGGWTRIAYLNMADSNANCPSDFREYGNDTRVCGRVNSPGPSCTSVMFPSDDVSYSEVCGRVVGYQFGSPEAVDQDCCGNDTHGNDIDSYYIDGISITTGNPRKHVWTLMAGVHSIYSYGGAGNCPCNANPGSNQVVPAFVGNDWYCESGNNATSWDASVYSSDPLWDGKKCDGEEQECCTSTDLPWFHRSFESSTSEYLELRICGDQSTSNEDVPFSFYEFYIK